MNHIGIVGYCRFIVITIYEYDSISFTFEVMSKRNPDFHVDITGIYFMDLKDSSSFITVKNIENRNKWNQSLAMEWIYSKKVGVMIASNLGRPGGACSQLTLTNKEFEFQEHPNASTQEESVLTFIHRIVKKKGRINYLDAQLDVLTKMFGMDLPAGDSSKDFIVKGNNGHLFNVRDSANPDDYDREFGSVINIVDRQRTNKIYISYVAGPNVMMPSNGKLDARRVKQGPGNDGNLFFKLDTMFRTISEPAMESYHLFRSMIVRALVASLSKMLQIDYKYAIMASPSSGIYAGIHKHRIQAEYHEVCIQALNETYFGTHVRSGTNNRFRAVIIPKY